MSEILMMKLKEKEKKKTSKRKIAKAFSSSTSIPIPIPIPTVAVQAGNTFADDFYLTALHDGDTDSDEDDYALQLQLQETLTSSSSAVGPAADSDSSRSSSRRRSSKSKPPRRSLCPICGDKRRQTEFFRGGCEHSYCNDCVSKYVASKIRENIVSVKCPDPSCRSALDPRTCRGIVPKQVLDRWEDALCESLIPAAQKFYCPFKDCSVVMEDDGVEEVTSAECPSCRRLFCAQCRVAWHAGVDCCEFQRRGKGQDETERKGEKLVKKLAEAKKWRRCPSCKFYVGKSQGCSHISCRCGYEFCYSCGSNWSYTHYCKSS